VSGTPKILVAGIGNIFFGDDAFGVEVAQRLRKRPLPPGVQVTDFGIRGFDLACELLGGWDAAILVDAVPRGGAPGTLYVIEPTTEGPPPPLEGHTLDPVRVLALARELGDLPRRVRVVGCEPAPVGTEPTVGLSAAVEAALEDAVNLVESEVAAACAARPDVP